MDINSSTICTIRICTVYVINYAHGRKSVLYRDSLLLAVGRDKVSWVQVPQEFTFPSIFFLSSTMEKWAVYVHNLHVLTYVRTYT